MGAKDSKASPPPPLPTLLDKPWREINWKDRQSALQYVKNYKPRIEGRQLRILLYGLSGAGNSSFINTVQSVLRGRMYALALVANCSGPPLTKKYTTYKMEKETPDTFYPFVFNDIMGLCIRGGVLVDDVKLVLMGRVKEDYEFNPVSKLSEGHQFYNSTVNPNDTVDVLVCVIPADRVSTMMNETVEKIWEIRRAASQLGIPQVAVITKIDQTCLEIKEDLKIIYKSIYMKKKMEQFSADVGIPMNCIFPVKNYSEEIDLNSDTDSLILNALRHIIDYGEDFMNHKMNQAEGLY